MRFRAERWLGALAGLALASVAPADQRAEPPPRVGTVLPSAPDVAPGRVAPDAPDALTLARARAAEDDWNGVISALGPWLDSRKAGGRERQSGLLLYGLAQLELQNWNLASGAFYRVRASDGPLASYGAWYEAVTDHKRGRHSSAASICREYRVRWPTGPEAENCLLLIGDASAMAGQRAASLAAYREYLERHPDTPRKEEIQLGIALATAVVSPQQAIPLLQGLVLSHSWHSTALSAQAALDELGAKGYAVALPTDSRSKMKLCESERRCGRFAEAWALFQELDALAEDDPEVARWVDQNEERITWGTRQFDVYTTALEQEYAKNPNGDLAWRIFVGWTREGDWKKAVSWERKAREAHGSHHRWKRLSEEMVWAETLAGEYKAAAEGWEQLARSRGGQNARFYAAFSTYRAGEYQAAIDKLSPLAERDGDWEMAALYWRAKARAALGDEEGAKADRARVRAEDRYGWYRLLLTDQPVPATSSASGSADAWLRRDGRWGGQLRGSLPSWTSPEARPMMAVGMLAMARNGDERVEDETDARQTPETSRPDWGALAWPMKVADSAGTAPPAEEARPLPTLPVNVPDGYQACLYYDPVTARKAFAQFSEQYKSIWPDLPAAHDLALAGAYEESARLVHEAWKEWDSAMDHADDPSPRSAQLRGVRVKTEDWRQYFLFTRAHYQAARFCAGLDNKAPSPEEAMAARRLAWPIVRGADLWAHGQDFDVDPLLMMGLMRQESTYASWAVSSANAIGLVQVMPSTGARVAALLGEGRYSPGDLEIPSVNLRYGTYYFSLLMRRFDGVFPLAVASYNGGPHNVSRWYRGWEGKIDLDAFVEQIQYPETRDYVKRVTGYYAEYVNLYGPRGARVVLPPGPKGDDAGVVDW